MNGWDVLAFVVAGMAAVMAAVLFAWLVTGGGV